MQSEVCGNCKYNTAEWDSTERTTVFYCDNIDSDYYGVPTEYGDNCEEWEESNIEK